MVRHRINARKHTVAGVILASLLGLGGCASQAPVRPAAEVEQAKTVAEFDVARSGRTIFLPVQFEGQTYQFVLDTGATQCVFDESFRARLGKPFKTIKAMTAGGPRDFHLYAAPEAFLADVSLKDSGAVMCLDMKMLGHVIGRELGGVLGMSVLRKYVVQIDFDRGKLALLKPDERSHPEWGQEVPLRLWKGVPLAKAKLPGGIEAAFDLDTGCGASGDLQSRLFETMVGQGNLDTAETLSETAAGTKRSREARIAKVSVAGLECTDLIFGEGPLSVLGLGWLSRFRVTFDFPNQKMYLIKGAQFDRRDETDMSGLHLLRIKGETVVHSVDEASPAQRAGVLAKDVILTVNDKPAGSYEMWEIRRLLSSQDKESIALTIRRGDQRQAITFALKKRI